MQHIFDVNVATKYGLTEAILLSNLYYWIEHNRANERNFYNGTYWTYNSVKAFKTLFPYLSERKIHNALKRLQEQGIIETGNFNENTYNRTLWYSLTKVGHCIMQKCKMDNAILSNGNVENVKSTYTDINQIENADNKTNTDKQTHKKQYAEAVSMTEQQYGKLLKLLKTDEEVQRWITRLSDYKMSTGKKYKSDYHTIRSWLNKDKPSYQHKSIEGDAKVKLQPIPFKSPAQIDREKRAVVGSAPPYTQEQRAIAEEYFNQFWAEYPKKQGQVEARLAWMRQIYSIETYIAIIKAVERFKQIRRDWQTEGGRYVPLPENFLIKERWKDEVKAETVQFDRPMDIALMAGMIMAEEKKNADERGHNIRMDGMARSRADITAGGEHRTVSDNEPFDVPAVWTP